MTKTTSPKVISISCVSVYAHTKREGEMVAEISGDHMIKVPKRAAKDVFGSHGYKIADHIVHVK